MFFIFSYKAVLGLAVAVTLASSAAFAEQRQIAITFDDAPTGDSVLMTGNERTRMLIDGLQEAGISGAMFFVKTGNIANADDALRLWSYTDAGHFLANHSHRHAWLRETTAAAYLKDMDQAAAVLSHYDSVVPFFRYPYLDEGNTRDLRVAVQAGLDARKLQNGYVTVDTYDWYMQAMLNEALTAGHDVDMERLGAVYVDVLLQGVAFYDRIAQDQLGRSPRHVFLLHENDLAALFLPMLVAALKADGWDIVPAMEAFKDPISQIIPETQFNGQGRVAAIAHAQGVPARDLVSPMEEEDQLRKIFRDNALLPK